MYEVIDNIVVIKVGTATLMQNENGKERLNQQAFQRIGQQVLRLRENGQHVVIFSSGAVSAGMEITGQSERPSRETGMPEIQRLASIGWRAVLNSWDKALEDAYTGGLLVTKRELDLSAPERDEVLRTTHSMLAHGDVPIVNENDPITHSELDEEASIQNDKLAAIFAAQVGRSALFGSQVRFVMLSDIDGLYTDINDPTSLIREVSDISWYEHFAVSVNSKHGSGGMQTKLEAARIATISGVEAWIANGQTDDAIQLAMDGQIGTHFTV